MAGIYLEEHPFLWVTLPAGAVAKSPIQNIADLGIDQMVIQADGYTFGATLGSSYFLRGGFARFGGYCSHYPFC